MWRKAAIVGAVLALGLRVAVGALASPAGAGVHKQPPLPPRGLPFTGSHLLAYTSLGVALLAGGLLLRLLTRNLDPLRIGRGGASTQAAAAVGGRGAVVRPRSNGTRALPNALKAATAPPPGTGAPPAMRSRLGRLAAVVSVLAPALPVMTDLRSRIVPTSASPRRSRLSRPWLVRSRPEHVLRQFSELLLLERHRRLLQIGDAVSSSDAEAIMRLRRELGEIEQLLYRSSSGWQVGDSAPAKSEDATSVGGGAGSAKVLSPAGARTALLFGALGSPAGRNGREQDVLLAARGGYGTSQSALRSE
jgi:hypothetical protein